MKIYDKKKSNLYDNVKKREEFPNHYKKYTKPSTFLNKNMFLKIGSKKGR